MIVGVASTTIPAALFMGRFGRKAGFMMAASYSCIGGLLAVQAINIESFTLFCVAAFLIGSHNAFVQQYRFAVAESVPFEKVGPSLSILMLAGVAAAFMGPEIAQRFQNALPYGQFSGSFLGLSGFMFLALIVLSFYQDPQPSGTVDSEKQRPISTILRQRTFRIAIGASVVGWAVMSLIMTATPVSMHEVEKFSLDDTAWVIQAHIMAMYLPSLFSGFLIARFGPIKIIVAGLVLLSLCAAIALTDRQLMHYFWALVLLGVGWNFMFLGGTTLLTTTYRPAERFKVQALNDFIVFSMQAIAALGSGFVLVRFGWDWTVGLTIPLLLLLLPVLFLTRGRLTLP